MEGGPRFWDIKWWNFFHHPIICPPGFLSSPIGPDNLFYFPSHIYTYKNCNLYAGKLDIPIHVIMTKSIFIIALIFEFIFTTIDIFITNETRKYIYKLINIIKNIWLNGSRNTLLIWNRWYVAPSRNNDVPLDIFKKVWNWKDLATLTLNWLNWKDLSNVNIELKRFSNVCHVMDS